jgi:hypothetical protein
MVKKMNSELAKLIYDLDGDEKAAFNVYNIRRQLTASWFEYYIAFFFEKKLWYKMKIPSKVYSADWWIDIKWIRRNEEGIIEYCIIQCKKHKWTTFWINDIRSFVWGIFHILHDFPTAQAYYITTSIYSGPALKYWNEKWISLKDYSYISEIYNDYSLSDFEKDIKIELPWKYKSIFNKWKDNKEIKAQWKLFSSEEDELLKTLKDIRYTIMKKVHIYESKLITNDAILEHLSRKRPHNLDSLKSSLYESNFSKEDINNTLIYANDYLKGLSMYA